MFDSMEWIVQWLQWKRWGLFGVVLLLMSSSYALFVQKRKNRAWPSIRGFLVNDRRTPVFLLEYLIADCPREVPLWACCTCFDLMTETY